MNDEVDRPDPRNLRASDADRERVAKVLHDSMAEGRLTVAELEERLTTVYAAKTIGQLEPVLSDLPVELHDVTPGTRPVPAVAGFQPPDRRIGGRPVSHNAVAVMSGVERHGHWVVPEKFNVVCVMGGAELDLTEASFAAGEVTIQVTAIMGGAEIKVPDDITVHVNGFGFLGAFVDEAHVVGPPGSPVVRITGFAMMGGVAVQRTKRRRRISE
ncbi:DUF1707 SHOCT-like domain-containing protein [Labedaea rhizosphaerae]|uniref:Cell wall-active antibiotic response 4TMS protein YvqF n=1 Tax=Labedaea rhizosphaerae TaxID=598644 RepID=A0A4V3D0H8_LABRH|nr:DUF1707 domain-containing protein [Labedaea rhizosphaerae]TDQ05955.1 cell wall-active antibiotic response 4TMS protein YvqF [Labedaea rhizosphaerae]